LGPGAPPPTGLLSRQAAAVAALDPEAAPSPFAAEQAATAPMTDTMAAIVRQGDDEE
jgi:hypothetical protein